ncbi:hypothetical protein ALC60_07797 [Trachymyrmex zeteki]|uniref:Uncharacterized protein n=1 Tax=Mycetomoellerius zeteki TaxID=64791 RepID=A0A151WYX0_9HYME|nr:hypothetical protein ALC60_07797 [Trachymyrmex zeteki]
MANFAGVITIECMSNERLLVNGTIPPLRIIRGTVCGVANGNPMLPSLPLDRVQHRSVRSYTHQRQEGKVSVRRRSDKLEHKRAGKVVAAEEGGGGGADEEGGGIRRWQSVAAVTRKTTTRRKAQGEA